MAGVACPAGTGGLAARCPGAGRVDSSLEVDAATDPATRAEATRIYVFEGLPNIFCRIDFRRFVVLFLIPLTLWLVLTRILGKGP